MTLPAWHEESIAKSHHRQAFDCGDAQMNEFLRRYARQSHEQTPQNPSARLPTSSPAGFSVSTPSRHRPSLTKTLTKGLARHEIVGFKLARIATDLKVAGHGLGGQLLAAAALRCLRITGEVGGVLLIIDAKNERAANWYAGYGAEPLKGKPLTLVMPLAIFAADLKTKGLF